MHGIYEVEKMLCDELDEVGSKGELTAGTLETVDKLAHALKNTQKIIEYYEEMGEYSNADGNMGNNTGGGSYARRSGGRYHGANQYGSYARGGRNGGSRRGGRYSYEGYSRAGGSEEMATQLRELMEDAPNTQIRHKIEQLITEVESM